ncbi:hypothetical protein ACODNH_21300 (plasmid) [Haloarcula sp. NS06]|uniref:hypothetical protein n=1 Tax=Haloarcula sp. NS06 TaxID=3409688 RepID=UPI003DA78BBA
MLTGSGTDRPTSPFQSSTASNRYPHGHRYSDRHPHSNRYGHRYSNRYGHRYSNRYGDPTAPATASL